MSHDHLLPHDGVLARLVLRFSLRANELDSAGVQGGSGSGPEGERGGAVSPDPSHGQSESLSQLECGR